MQPLTIKSKLSAPQGRWLRAGVMAAVVIAISGLPWMLAPLGPDAGPFMVVVGVGCLIAISVLFLNHGWTNDRSGWFKALVVTSLVAAISAAVVSYVASQAAEMKKTGLVQAVTVTAQRYEKPLWAKRSSGSYHYKLALDGKPLNGELSTSSDLFEPGDSVRVYTAPSGRWHELASSVEYETEGTLTHVAAAIVLLALPMCMATGYLTPFPGPAEAGQGMAPKRRRVRDRHKAV